MSFFELKRYDEAISLLEYVKGISYSDDAEKLIKK